MNVLLVDDETQIRNILSETLEAAGFHVRACDGGASALALLDAQEPEVMVTDLRMPGMSGMRLFEAVRKRYPDIQVIILTGYGDMKSAVEALRLGAYDYLNKPVDAERLVQTIKNGAERRRLILENRNLIANLREANRIKTAFLHGMSHEIRTPLGHITGFAEILEQTIENITERQERYLSNIQKAAKKLLRMFDDILQYADMNSGETVASYQAVCLPELAENVRKNFADLIQRKNLRIDASRLAFAPAVFADEKCLSKMFEVIFKNAVQFSPENGAVDIAASLGETPDLSGALSADPPEASGETWLHLAVSDQGPGIAPEDQKRIFNLFEQADSSLTREHEGTGLGLSLANSLAKQHGGLITVQSAPKKGSTFTIVIPVKKDSHESQAPSP